jgi:hypothetical protein
MGSEREFNNLSFLANLGSHISSVPPDEPIVFFFTDFSFCGGSLWYSVILPVFDRRSC